MRVEQGILRIKTEKSVQVMDITELVQDALREMNAGDGILHIFLPHTTVGITINEAEPGLLEDIQNLLEKLAPELGGYQHNRVDNNAHAHLRNVLTSSFVVIPVSQGSLYLGTWQRILLLESDGPHQRELVLTYIGL